MPVPAFTLKVPTAQSYRDLVSEAVKTFLRVSGEDTSAAAEAFVADVAAAVDALASSSDEIGLAVTMQPPTVEVRLTCGSAERTLPYTLAGGA